METFKVLLDVWPVLLAVLNGLSFWIVWSMRHFVREELGKAQRSFDERIAHIERAVASRPEQDDFVRLSERMTEIHGSVERLVGQMEANSRQLNLLIEYHLGRTRGE
ncbi:MAG: DUF2730 family protein [Magnetococcales bacterium]|nr:DUF2730 family protein [Magnetococcales bacterium]